MLCGAVLCHAPASCLLGSAAGTRPIPALACLSSPPSSGFPMRRLVSQLSLPPVLAASRYPLTQPTSDIYSSCRCKICLGRVPPVPPSQLGDSP